MWNKLDRRKWLALGTMPLFVVLIIVLAGVDPTTVFNLPYLLPALNLLFLAAVPLSVAYLARKSYMSDGSAGMLLTSWGMAVLGMGVVASTLVLGMPGGVNPAITIHNTSALLASLLLALASLLFILKPAGSKAPAHAELTAGLGLLVMLLIMSFVTMAALQGLTPLFFVQGEGPTALRQVILVTATVLMAISATIFLLIFFRTGSGFPFWFSMGLALTTIGMCAFFLQVSVGSAVGWAGRAAQYLGGIYMLAGVVTVTRAATQKGITVSSGLADAFAYSEADYRALVEMATDAIISCDDEGRVLTWNRAATKIFGYSPRKAIGEQLAKLILPGDSAAGLSTLLKGGGKAADQAWSSNPIETTAMRKGGWAFPAEISTASRDIAGQRIGTFIIRDLTSQQKAREDLRESEERYRNVVENAGDSILVAQDGLVKFCNPRTLDILGFTAAEADSVLSQPFTKFVHPDDAGMVADNYARRLKGETLTPTYNFRAVDRNGNIKWLEINAIRINWEGRPATLNFIRDITARILSEQEIARERGRAQKYLDTVETIIVSLDASGRVTSINRKGCQLFGASEDDMVGQQWFSTCLPQPDGMEKVYPYFLRLIAGEIEAAETFENAIITRSGEVRQIAWHNALIYDERKRVTGTLSSGQDITEHKQAQEELKNSEERFKRVSALSSDIAYSCRTDETGSFHLDWMAGAVLQTTGYSIDEVMAQTCWRFLVIEQDVPVFEKNVTGLMPGESAICELRIKHKDGRELWLRSFNECAKEDAGGKGRLYGALADITQRKRADDALLKANSMLSLAQEASSAGAWDWDMASGQLTWTDELFKLFGLDPAQDSANFDTWRAILHPEDRQAAEDRINDAIRDHVKLFNEYRIVTPQGGVRWIHAWGNTEYDEKGSARRMTGLCMDVTEARQTHEALLSSETRYTELFSRISSAVAVYEAVDGGEDFIFRDFNSAAEKIEHVTRDEILGRRVTEVFPGVKDFGIFAAFQRVWRTGKPEVHPMNFYTDARDPGTWRESWVYKLPGGELVAIYDDVTQRKRDQDAILQSKVLLQNVIDSTPDWMYVKDREHRFLLVNRSFAEAQHLEPQDVVGRPDSDFFSEELCLGNPEKGITGFHQDDLAAFSGKLVHNPRNVISWVDGTRHTYDTYKIPLTDQAGKIYGALVYSRDITAQARLEDERESTLRTLEKSLANTIDTVAMVVEMRDPYTAGHQRRVARLCGAIAESMGWDDRRIENLLMAAKIHDIGKMYVPADILSKPGKLSETEFSLIKTHARGGYEILRKIEFQGPVALMALQHHERMDGSGYPDGIIGEEILFESRILAVADVVEAMSSHRPYRPARGMDAALEEMAKNRGRLYDAEVVDACLGLFRQGKFKFDE